MRLSLLLLLCGCSVLRDADDFQVGDAGALPDAAFDGSADSDSSTPGCTRDDQCDLVFDHAMPRCEVMTGQCVLGACADGFRSCDNMMSTGCETPVNDVENCGDCEVTCSGTSPLCAVMASGAMCTDDCGDQTQCGDLCVDTNSNALNCGACDVACDVPDGALMAVCADSDCGFECNVGRGDCDDAPDNGCEVTTTDDPANCGSCGMICTTGANVAATSCTDSVCGIGECAAGFRDCDGDPDNGCEANLNDASNCGACAALCGAPLTCQNQICDTYVKVAVAVDHVCALRESGAIDCWGGNEAGQISPNQVPVEAPERLRWEVDGVMQDVVARDVSVGFGHTCFIARSDDTALDGTLFCQGSNSSIEGGRAVATPSFPAQPVQIRGAAPTPKFRSLSSRNFHSCAIDSAGGLWCWGIDGASQTGPNLLATRFAQRVPMPSGVEVLEVATTQDATCVLLSDRTVHCFGANQSGQLGRDTIVPAAMETFGTPAPVVGLDGTGSLGGVDSIAAGTNEFCAIHRTSRDLVCWGWNINTTIRLAPGAVPRPTFVDTGVAEVFMFHLGTCWSNAMGQTSCRGREIEGYFGRGPANDVFDANTRITELDGISGAAAGYRGACGFRDGELHCWGWSAFGGIPRSSIVEETPAAIVDTAGVPIDGLANVVAAREGSCGIRTVGSDSIAHCWGAGGRSTSGDGTNLSPPTPQAVPGLTAVVGIARSNFSVCAIEGGLPNQLYCWGAPNSGSSAGVGNASVATLAAGVADPVSLDMGHRHGCAVLRDDTVRCWGYSVSGETSIVAPSVAPTTVMMAGSAILASQVVTGFNFSCAILLAPAGQVVCWGNNLSGQLGLNTTSAMEAPTITLVDDAVSLEAGFQHICAVRDAGGVVCWGSNESGQLASPDVSTAIQLVTLPRAAISVAAGYRSSCAALDDGSVYCWGDNLLSQLGSPGPSNTTPQVVPGVTDATSVSNSSDLGFANCAGNDTAGTWQCWGLNTFGKLGTTPDLFFAPTLIDRSAP